jgi:hypothetical protein
VQQKWPMDKKTKNNMAIILLCLIVLYTLILVSFVSAGVISHPSMQPLRMQPVGLTKTMVDSPSKNIQSIKNSFNNELATYQLLYNTKSCGGDLGTCFAVIKITLNNPQSNLVSGLNFVDKADDSDTSLSYDLQIRTDTTPYEEYNPDNTYDTGVYYIKISSNKNKIDVIDWIPEVLGSLDITEWAIWGNYYTYDDLNGNRINQTLWNNQTSYVVGYSSATTTQNNNLLTAHAQDSSAFSTQASASIESRLFPNSVTVGSLSFASNLSCSYGNAGDSSTATITVFGVILSSVTCGRFQSFSNNSLFNLQYNYTNGNFDVYLNGAYYNQITPTNSNISIYAHGNSNGGDSADAILNVLNYTYNNNTLFTTLLPVNNAVNYFENNVIFNISENTTINNLQNVSLYINNVLNSYQNISGTVNNTVFNIPLGAGVYTWNVYICDDSANCRFSNTNTLYNTPYYINSESYNGNVFPGATEDFSINFTMGTGQFLNSVYLVYNGIPHYLTSLSQTGNNIVATQTLGIPGNYTASSYNFYWQINTNSGIFNTSSHTQNITQILLTLCNATYTTTAINFTLEEEATFNKLNGSATMAFTYWPAGGDESINQNFSYTNLSNNNSNFALCISPSDINLTVSGIIQYSKIGYDARTYYLNKANINNLTQNINLYLASTLSTDTFTFNIIDENNNPVQGAYIYVQRWDIGTNNLYTIGMIQTDSIGQAIINLRLTDAYYRELIYYNGKLYLTTTPSLESTTTTPKTIRIYLNQPPITNNVNNIPYTFSYNNYTSTFQFIYGDPTGVVQSGCLNIYTVSSWNGTNNIYSSCVQSTSGTLLYQLTQNGSYIGEASFIFAASPNSKTIAANIPVTLGGAPNRSIFKTYGFVAALLLIGTLGLLGVSSGNITFSGFLIIAGAVVSNLIGLVNIPVALLYSLIGLIVIMVVIATKRYG